MTMHVIILIENIVLTIGSWDALSKLSSTEFIDNYPIVVLGLYFFSLICKLIYYQVHAWPISATACIPRTNFHQKRKELAKPEEILELLPIDTDPTRLTGKITIRNVLP